MRKRFFVCISVFLYLCISACAPREQAFLPTTDGAATFEKDIFITSDGARLSYRDWLPKKSPRAVVLALHGMNDYSHAFESTGEYFSKRSVAVFAYDQRGFGASPEPGIWAGSENLRRDLREFIHALHKRYPDKPIFVLGESMGGAVAIDTLASDSSLNVKGLILAAPAVWGGDSMMPAYRLVLWLTAYTFPYSSYDGSDLKILASNNIPMLRAMGADPLVLKRTRADAILGLVRLMDGAYTNVENLSMPTLMLYGGKDEVIPSEPINDAIAKFNHPITLAYYPGGYHMLLRDLQGEMVLDDILSWIANPQKSLPSGMGKSVDKTNNALFSRD